MIKHHLQLKSTKYLQRYMMYSVHTAMSLKGDGLSPPAAYAPFFDDHKRIGEEEDDESVHFIMLK